MYMNKAIKMFLEGYFSTCERSQKTISAYSCDIAHFGKRLGKNLELSSVTSEQIEDWAVNLKNENYAPASIKRKLASLKAFFNYWVRKKSIACSPLWNLKLDFGNRTALPKILSIEEINKIFLYATRETQIHSLTGSSYMGIGFLALRNLAILELLLATGIRVGELTSLSLADLSVSERAIKIKGKGNRQRMAFLTDNHCLDVVSKYIEKRQKFDTNHSAIFINVFRNPLRTQGVANVVAHIANNAGINKHITPHMIRHTAATLLLRSCGNLRVVQEYLGHASIVTTQRYTHVTKEHLLLTLKTHHPGLFIER